MPDLKFAELIDGHVCIPSPASYAHGRRHSQFAFLVEMYAVRTAVCEPVSNATWRMVGNAPQPDVALRLLPEFGGRTTISEKLANGAPELIVEVAYSSRSIDLGPKAALYQAAGVTEYVIVLLEEQRVDWRVLEDGSYRALSAQTPGVLKSRRFPGLWLNEPAFWQKDGTALLATLEEGLGSEECRKFKLSTQL